MNMKNAQTQNYVGVIISQENGQIIGKITKDGRIIHSHNSFKRDKPPYIIVIRNKLNRKNTELQKIARNNTVIAQCVNDQNMVTAVIVRVNNANHYVTVIPSQPLMGIPIMGRITNKPRKCPAGYHPNNRHPNVDWLSYYGEKSTPRT